MVILIIIVDLGNVIFAATLTGGEGNDRIIGTNSADTINGRGGDDYINGGAGDDYILSGWGDDQVYGGEGNDRIEMSIDGDLDNIYGQGGDDEIGYSPGFGGCGLPIVYGNIIDGGTGNDVIRICSNSAKIFGGLGNDLFEGWAPIINMGDGNDIVDVDTRNKEDARIDGGDGYDIFVGGDGNYSNIRNFEKFVTAYDTPVDDPLPIRPDPREHLITDENIPASKRLIISASSRGVFFNASTVSTGSIECISRDAYGSAAYFAGQPGRYWYQCYGGLRNDTFRGSIDNDIFRGNAGNDYIDGGDGRDIAIYSGNYADYTVTEITYNQFEIVDNRADSPDGTDTLIDINTLRFADGDQKLVIAGMEIIGNDGVNTLNGGPNADSINALAGNDVVRGFRGNDYIVGGKGNDQVWGGDGNDIFDGNDAGNDQYYGEDGSDTITYERGRAGVKVNLLLRNATGLDIGIDKLFSIEKVIGSKGNDVLQGDDRLNELSGGAGNDTINGRGRKDILSGGTGKDIFMYASIKDSLTGSHRRDVIRDFNGGAGDRINLSTIDAFSGRSGNQAFVYIGSNTFSGRRGEVRFSSGLLQINTGQDMVADMEIELTGVRIFDKRYLVP